LEVGWAYFFRKSRLKTGPVRAQPRLGQRYVIAIKEE